MKTEELSLWRKIQDFELDDPGSDYTFSERLSRENGWKLEYTLRVIDEYKKFIFLQCISEYPLTPSDQVDQVWHLHLLYTRSYWIDWCEHTLGRTIHHGPTKGGKSENDKFKDWYELTKTFYLKTFKEEWPADIWPDGANRFSDIHFRRINLKQNWIIRKLNPFRK